MSKLIRRWEFVLVVLLAAVFVIMSRLSPYFLDLRNLLDATLNFTEKGIIALCMALIVITGSVDLSVASNMAMSAAVMGIAYRSGMGAVGCCFDLDCGERPCCHSSIAVLETGDPRLHHFAGGNC